MSTHWFDSFASVMHWFGDAQPTLLTGSHGPLSTHWLVALHTLLIPHVPHVPPQPFAPHCLPAQFGTHAGLH